MPQASETPAKTVTQIDGRSTGERNLPEALRRGGLMRCPACGKGSIFGKYLKVNDHCPSCSEALHHHRADDAPPYFTIVIVGHVIVSLVLAVEMAYHPPLWVHSALWIPLTVLMALCILPPIKGALVGLQWALLMHGFDPNAEEDPIDTGEPGGSSYFPSSQA
ncbi:DUF983 domain-containing protein [Methyloligella sp. 2.7D]|uniref:DUF983 domain-containing protein n=1 Tax=unclassified Methyloligella TaxID=2625955 RepID=UPI00157BED86|nr:DUF983 domain-containing protein [Methyloligella sp. GL2]QKP77422.1 DUF983 domain-containing protein [Methyloligella sp. GL2]